MSETNRCGWTNDIPIYNDYHDYQWGRPVHDDNMLFEMLILEGMQAGLSWLTVLNKRENFRLAFDQFDPEKIAKYDEDKIQELLQNEGIIRNKLKVNGAVKNAKAFLAVVETYGSFAMFLWRYVDNTPIINKWKTLEEVPASTPLSDQISKDLKKLGFTFVGSTIIYAFMQAIGMVNDHLTSCCVYDEIAYPSSDSNSK